MILDDYRKKVKNAIFCFPFLFYNFEIGHKKMSIFDFSF